MTIHFTEDGGVEFIGIDNDGNERRIKFRPNDDGSFDVETGPPDESNGKTTTIDPSGGTKALGN